MFEKIILYFETIPSTHRTAILVGGLSLFWIIEQATPFVKDPYPKSKHGIQNLLFTLFGLIINLGFAFLIVLASDFTSANTFGLLYLINLPLWLHFLFAMLLLDLIGAYFIHWLEHKVPWMWKIHAIHHGDEHVDVSTALRHHPLEFILRASFTVLAVLVAGVPIGMVMIYQSLSALFSQFNHANLNTPKLLSKTIGRIFVLPDMHRTHHHFEAPYTDRNYGNIFSIWDRIFGTYIYQHPSELKMGLDIFQRNNINPQKIKEMIRFPFVYKKEN